MEGIRRKRIWGNEGSFVLFTYQVHPMKLHFAAHLLFAAFCCCSSKNGQKSDIDVYEDVTDDDTNNPSDTYDDHVEDSLEDDILDTIVETDTCDPVIYGTAYDLSFLDVPELHPRSATRCGECCRQVSFSQYSVNRCFYDVSNRYIVLSTLSDASPLVSRTFIIDLDTLDHRVIAEASSELTSQYLWHVHINSGVVLYHNIYMLPEPEDHAMSQYYLLNLDTHDRRAIFEVEHPLGGHPYHLAFSGQWLAWIDYNEYAAPSPIPVGLWVMDVSWSDARLVDTGIDSIPMGLDIYEDDVVYSELSHWVRVYNITSDTITDVAGSDTFDWDRYNPSIWGDTVIWHDVRNGGSYASQTHADIYKQDITGGTEAVVCEDPASQPRQADIGYGYVAWPDARNDPEPNEVDSSTNLDIYALNISSGEEIAVSTLPRGQYCPIIFENRIYFLMEDDFGVMSVFEKVIP
jgi:hypothetical protein